MSDPKFKEVYCSQCGCSFGPGNHGFSHCTDHTETEPAAVSRILRLDMEKMESRLQALQEETAALRAGLNIVIKDCQSTIDYSRALLDRYDPRRK